MVGPLGLQLSIVLCVGMVAATLAPAVRRAMPRWFEVAMWLMLVVVCWLGVAGIKEPHTRELTASVNWAAGQIISTLVGLAVASVGAALSVSRFWIANAVVTLMGADLLALALISSRRQGQTWQPRVRLRDWVEIPPAVPDAPVMVQPVPYAVDELNERLAAATAVAGAAAATWSVQFLIWARDEGLPRAEERLGLALAAGRVEAGVWLDSIRETAGELESSARTWASATVPEVNRLALKVAAILNGVAESQRRIAPAAGTLAQVVDIQAFRIAQSLGRSGRATPTDEEADENGRERPDQLAS